MKRRITFLEFCTEVRGYKFKQNGQTVPKYILYWKGYDTSKLIFNRTNIQVETR
jgi:hypothetical protein